SPNANTWLNQANIIKNKAKRENRLPPPTRNPVIINNRLAG
ncbi:unnamed protein product, partial [marine sediment metagenome]